MQTDAADGFEAKLGLGSLMVPLPTGAGRNAPRAPFRERDIERHAAPPGVSDICAQNLGQAPSSWKTLSSLA